MTFFTPTLVLPNVRETSVRSEVIARIIDKARDMGASLAGVARVAELRDAPSYQVYHKSPYYRGFEGFKWPEDAESVLVMALYHDPSEPEIDWWGHIPGKTPGNWQLMRMAASMQQWLGEELGIGARPLPYRVEEGGMLLKDAAVLAGLGIIGRNNIVVTPEFGPRVRLRGLFVDVKLEPTGPLRFDPCRGCSMPCRRACPQRAFRNSSYSRALCDRQMTEDAENPVLVENWVEDYPAMQVVKYCRACELACPVPR
jgi:epoxyqueuosine reductase